MGKRAAEWNIAGETMLYMFAWDVARFGAWAGKDFSRSRVADQYAHRFAIHFPNEESGVGRSARNPGL